MIPAVSTRMACSVPMSSLPNGLGPPIGQPIGTLRKIRLKQVHLDTAHVALRAVALKANRVKINTLVTSATSVACAMMAVVCSMFIIDSLLSEGYWY